MKRTTITIARFLLFVMAMLLMAGLFACKTPKEKVEETFDKFPKETKQECVIRHPLTPSTIVEIKYKEGRVDTLNRVETKYINCDSVKPDSSGKKIVKCPPFPPSTRQVDTMFIDSSKTIIDTRLVDLKNDTLNSLRSSDVLKSEKISALKVAKANLISYLVISLTLLAVAVTIIIKKSFL
jgi:hypothetical protein